MSIIGKRFTEAAALMIGCLLLGCAPHTGNVNLPLSGPEGFSRSGQEELAADWWTVFGDETLNRVVDTALEDNFSLKSAWQRLRAARAIQSRAAGELWPDLDLSLQARESHGEGTGNNFDAEDELQLGLTSVYEVDLWGRISSAAEAEAYRADASLADYRTAALSLTAEIVRAWYGLAEARRQVALFDRQVTTNENLLELLEARFGHGLVPSVDILRHRQLLEDTREQRYYARSRQETFEHQLAVLSGRQPQGANFPQASALPALPALPDTGIPLDLIRRRPDIQSAHRQLLAADRDLAVAISNQYPRLSLSLSATTAGESADDLFDEWFRTLTGELLSPVFRGGALQAEVERTEAVKRQRLNQYAQAVLTAFREVEDALVRERRQHAGVDSLGRQMGLARRAYEQLRVQYLNGAADYLDVLTALAAVQDLERERLSARLTLLDYRISLYRALAGPIPGRDRDNA